MNALADPNLGEFLNEHFVSAFQKVGTFRIVGDQKQGGNVASYFCAPDGRVLHVVAGPVDAATLLKEARWVVDTVREKLAEHERTGASFKSLWRQAHAERLAQNHGLKVQAVTFDTPVSGEVSALSYRDPSGEPLAPVLPPPPIQGPDVSFDEELQQVVRRTAGARELTDIAGRRCYLDPQGQVHQLLAAHSLKKIETLYGSIFEGILGETVSTKPVVVATPFPWIR